MGTTDAVEGDGLTAFRDYRSSGDRSLRNRLVEEHQGLAYHFAHRYADRGIETDDLRQVAVLGLVKAVERFDPDRGVDFASFARPYVVGELRHHFRDLGWEVHVPRSLKERAQQVRGAMTTLQGVLHREPTPADLAGETGLTVDEVLEALDVARSTRTKRFEAEAPDGSAPDGMHPVVHDEGYVTVEQRIVLGELLARLDERDQRVVTARFIEEKSQQEIADEVGVSQVHVSRLLRRILAELQGQLEPDDGI